MYKRLRELEAGMEERIARKRRDLDTQVRLTQRNARRKLRVRVYHLYTPSQNDNEEGCWTLRIEGSIPNEEAISEKFSSFFRKVIVELDSSIYNEGDHVIEWTCFRSAEPTDGFEITRKGSQAHTVKIKLLRNYSPERFQVSDHLLKLIGPYMKGRQDDTKQNIVLAVWQYIKNRNLLERGDARYIVADPGLEAVLGKKKIIFNELLAHIKPHLQPLVPTELSYYLSLEGTEETMIDEQVFDVEIDTQKPLDQLRNTFLEQHMAEQHAVMGDLHLYEEQCKDLISQLNQLSQEHEWLKQFTEDPCSFIRDVITSQNADLAILAAAYASELSLQDSGEFYRQGWVKDAIGSIWSAAT